MKAIALFRAFLHWIVCRKRGDTIIEHSGPANVYLPVTRIYCDGCDKTFYKRTQPIEYGEV